MTIDYSITKAFTQMIDIPDAGDCCLRCKCNDFTEHYIIVKTWFGKVNMIEFGPVFPDAPELLPGFYTYYKKFDYKESVLKKELAKFINDSYKNICEVELCEAKDVWRALPELEPYFTALENDYGD